MRRIGRWAPRKPTSRGISRSFCQDSFVPGTEGFIPERRAVVPLRWCRNAPKRRLRALANQWAREGPAINLSHHENKKFPDARGIPLRGQLSHFARRPCPAARRQSSPTPARIKRLERTSAVRIGWGSAPTAALGQRVGRADSFGLRRPASSAAVGERIRCAHRFRLREPSASTPMGEWLRCTDRFRVGRPAASTPLGQRRRCG